MLIKRCQGRSSRPGPPSWWRWPPLGWQAMASSQTCPPKTGTRATQGAGRLTFKGSAHARWVASSPRAPVPAWAVFSPVLISQETQRVPLLIEQFCAERREDLWRIYHRPGAWATCLARRSPAGWMCFMAHSEDKHKHFYVTCCHINTNLYFFQNF